MQNFYEFFIYAPDSVQTVKIRISTTRWSYHLGLFHIVFHRAVENVAQTLEADLPTPGKKMQKQG
jgi:hypothetical protein